MHLRLYAVTGRNKLCASVLSALILAQIASGLGLTIVAGIRPRKFLNHLLVCVQRRSHVSC